MSLPLPLPQPPNPPFLVVVTLFVCILFPSYLCLPDNDDSASTTLQTLKPILLSPSPSPGPGPSPSPSPSYKAATIPAFPEQSDVEGCPLTLSDELFDGIKSACGATKHGAADMELHRTRCCPVLAAWLYSAYSATALSHSPTTPSPPPPPSSSSYDMPLLPDDSGTCVNELGKALKVRGVELISPNETCDVVYCFCGIKLHPLTCPDAFSVAESGELVGDASVRRLQRNCISTSTNVNGFAGLGGCSKCLDTLHLLNKKTSHSSKAEDRTTKIHNKDCELMGLTWLLAKNRTAYFHTVLGVLRALMSNTDGSNPESCTLNSDGMPLAVDSSQISDHSSSANLQAPVSLCLLLLCFLLLMQFAVLSS